MDRIEPQGFASIPNAGFARLQLRLGLHLIVLIVLALSGCAGGGHSEAPPPPPSGPSIATPPSNQTVKPGQSATFAVVATGAAPLNFQWQKNGATIAGATAPIYTTPTTTPSDNGSEFTVVVSNSIGSASSSPAMLSVVTLNSIAVTPNPAASIAVGTSEQFTAIGNYSDGSTENLSVTATWNSTNTAAATINASGLAHGLAIGATIITASLSGVTSPGVSLTVSAATVNSIAVTPNPAASIAAGTTEQFTATGTYSDGSTQNLSTTVTWNSTNTATATINASGLAHGVAIGATAITASFGGLASPGVSQTVTAATLVSIAVTPNPAASIAAGTNEQFTATGTYTDGSTQNLSATATWNSTTTATATINASGLAHGLAIGTTTITASLSGVASSGVSLTVTAATVSSIAVTPNPSAPIDVGTTEQFSATGTYSDGSTQNLTNSASWNSTNTAAVTINASGLAHGVAIGTTTITATFGGLISPGVSLTVSAATLTSIAVTPNPAVSIAAGTSEQFTATGTYSDGSTQNLTSAATWNSTNAPAATISGSGIAHGIAIGSTTITASLTGVTSTGVSLIVTAAALASIAVTPNPAASIAAGTSEQFTATGTYTDGSTQNFSTTAAWNSTNPAAATINASGLAHGVAIGSTTITASLSGVISPGVSLTVTAATLSSLAVTPNPAASIAAGTNEPFTATGTYSDGSTQNLSATTTWNSTNTGAATINASGFAHGVAIGTTTIAASLSGVSSPGVSLTVTAATLNSISVTPNPAASIAAGTSEQFTAMGSYSDGSTQNLSTTAAWNSTNTGAATINASGFAHGVAIGTTTITASLSGVTSPGVSLTVTVATLSSILVTPNPAASIAAGMNEQFTATGSYTDGSTQNLSTTATWNSTNPAAGTINASGSAHGVTIGTTTITASLSGVTSPGVSLAVTAATLVTIAVTPNPAASIAAGTNEQFTATGTYSDGSAQNLSTIVTWNSTNTAAATINVSGMAHGVAIGSTTITASLNGLTSQGVGLTVTAATLSSIAVTPNPAASIAAGTTKQFTATGTYTDGSTQNFSSTATWTSTNTAAAAINASGLAHGVAIGTTTITASFSGVTSPGVSLTVTAATVVSIAVTPNPAASIAAGTNEQFTATGTYSDGSTRNLSTTATWNSTNTTAARINASGRAHGVAVGTATITASLSGVTSPDVNLTVTPATLVSIAVTPNPAGSIPAGTTKQFTATGTYTDHSTQNLTATAAWNSTNSGAATIGVSGLAHGVAIGNTTIMASFSGVTSPGVSLTVTAAIVVSIAVTPNPAPSIAAGTTEQFTATGTYSDGSMKILTNSATWHSASTAAATINASGLARGVAIGTTTITASQSGVTSPGLSVTVTAAILVSIAVTPNPAASISPGNTEQFTATGTYTDGSTTNLTSSVAWNTSNSAVASINNAGLAQAAAVGATAITASLSGVTSPAVSLSVISATLVSISVNPNPAASIAAGTSEQFVATGTYSDGSTQHLTTAALWNAADPGIASINNVGLAQGIAAGATTITANFNGVTSLGVSLAVTPAALVSIAVTPNPAAPILPGAGEQFTATATYTNGTTQDLTSTATWSSAAQSVATIGATGLAQGLAIGTTTIAATMGSVTSPGVALPVETLPSINPQPSNQTVLVNETATFSVGASGADLLSYQWQLNGVDITGATSPGYTTPPTTSADNGSLFTVVVTDPIGSVTSIAANLTVIQPASPLTYYVDFVSGSDGNSGITKATAWKYAPGMNNCSSNCGSVTLNPGDSVIFKGGVRWDNSGFPFVVAGSGSAGNPIYFGVDNSWFSGNSWTRPTFDFSGLIWTVSPVQASGASFITFDNLEMENEHVDSANQAPPRGSISVDGGTNITIQNCYIHSWSIQNPTVQSDNNPFGGITFFGNSSGGTVSSCVLDGAPANDSGIGIYGGTVILNNVVENSPNGIWVSDTQAVVSGNRVFNIRNSVDPTVQANGILIAGGGNVYNNVVHDLVPSGIAINLQSAVAGIGNTQNVYNNLVWTAGNNPPVFINPGPVPIVQPSFQSVLNNTMFGGANGCVGVLAGTILPTNLIVENNHCISDESTSPAWCWNAANGVSSCGSVANPTFANNVLMTTQTALSQGFTVNNSLQPTAASNSIVGAGQNMIQNCVVVGSSFCSDRLGVARPSGIAAWDDGAYVYQGAAGNLPPTLTTQPASLTVKAGQTATFSVVAAGGAPLSYQWLENGTIIAGAISPSFTTPATIVTDSGERFAVVVSNSAGSVTSSTAILSVDNGPGQLTPSTSALNFPNTLVGTGSIFVVTLTSSGNSTITISSVAVTGAGFAAYNVPAGLILAPGQVATMSVAFNPAIPGNMVGSVSVGSDASNSPVIIQLSGRGVVPHSVTMNWTASTTPTVIGYSIYRSTSQGGPYTLLGFTIDPSMTYTDPNVMNGQTYYYVVTSVDSDGVESVISSEVSALIPPF